MRRTLALAALLGTSTLHAAPGIDIYAGAYNWDSELEGSFSSQGPEIDVEDDLGFSDADQTVIYLGVEHAVPLIPNVRVRYMDLSDSASSTLQRNIDFNGETFNASTRVDTDIDLEMLDGTLYYSPLDGPLKLDLGLTIRQLDGDIRLTNGANDTAIDVDEVLPLLHAGAGVSLPLPGMYAGAEINTVKYDGSSMTDYNARIGWQSDYLLGLELGYNRLQIELDDVSDLDTDLEMGGPYLALTLGF